MRQPSCQVLKHSAPESLSVVHFITFISSLAGVGHSKTRTDKHERYVTSSSDKRFESETCGRTDIQNPSLTVRSHCALTVHWGRTNGLRRSAGRAGTLVTFRHCNTRWAFVFTLSMTVFMVIVGFLLQKCTLPRCARLQKISKFLHFLCMSH